MESNQYLEVTAMLKLKKVKVEELSGAALDWAVRRVEEEDLCESYHPHKYVLTGKDCPIKDRYSPSTKWEQGGPILESEGIELQRGNPFSEGDIYRGLWLASLDFDEGDDMVEMMHGRTVLEAAMRCYVASHLGLEVEIPEGL